MNRHYTYFLSLLFSLFFLFSCNSTPRAQNPYKDIKISGEAERLGKAVVGVKAFLSSQIKAMEVQVSYYAFEDLVSLDYRYQGVGTSLYLNATARLAIERAFEKYIAAYEVKDLPTGKKTEQAYGSGLSMVKWGTIMRSNLAYPEFLLGYTYNNQHPYFILTVLETKNDEADYFSPGDLKNAVKTEMFLTRKHMEQILELFKLIEDSTFDTELYEF